jgi:hypothetical protein
LGLGVAEQLEGGIYLPENVYFHEAQYLDFQVGQLAPSRFSKLASSGRWYDGIRRISILRWYICDRMGELRHISYAEP